eukprot:TRINITY_DN3420_c0_g1_i1.p1 TRINITY_DN3420_c0_g1~~TRINITY_DN3420_c0_g1_i1.p1  ORF type:complete len:2058 (+),score=194.52 TRINITY_DN3420_c0_g1_i1:28-6201(+)
MHLHAIATDTSAAAVARVSEVLNELKSAEIWRLTEKDSEGQTPLHVAAGSGNVVFLQGALCALRNDEWFDVEDRAGRTPLHLAAANGHCDCVAFLLDRGVRCEHKDSAGSTALCLTLDCVALSKLATIQLLLDSGCRVTVPASAQFSPIHKACMLGDVASVSLIVKASKEHLKAFIDSPDDEGNTPLAVAVRHGQFELASELLRLGARADVSNITGDTPLHLTANSASCQDPERRLAFAANLLGILSASALGLTNNKECTAYDLAIANNNTALATLLENHSNSVSCTTPDGLECQICQDFIYLPTTLTCGHTFCLPCAQRSIPSDTGLCPFRCQKRSPGSLMLDTKRDLELRQSHAEAVLRRETQYHTQAANAALKELAKCAELDLSFNESRICEFELAGLHFCVIHSHCELVVEHTLLRCVPAANKLACLTHFLEGNLLGSGVCGGAIAVRQNLTVALRLAVQLTLAPSAALTEALAVFVEAARNWQQRLSVIMQGGSAASIPYVRECPAPTTLALRVGSLENARHTVLCLADSLPAPVDGGELFEYDGKNSWHQRSKHGRARYSLTYDQRSDRFFVYAPVRTPKVHGIPKEEGIQLRLFEELLRSDFCSELPNCGVAIDRRGGLIMLHFAYQLGALPHTALREQFVGFQAAVDRLGQVMAHICCESKQGKMKPAGAPVVVRGSAIAATPEPRKLSSAVATHRPEEKYPCASEFLRNLTTYLRGVASQAPKLAIVVGGECGTLQRKTDAFLAATALRRVGFHAIVLTGAAATCTTILRALHIVHCFSRESRLTAFHFYFSGAGAISAGLDSTTCGAPGHVILPCDSSHPIPLTLLRHFAEQLLASVDSLSFVLEAEFGTFHTLDSALVAREHSMMLCSFPWSASFAEAAFTETWRDLPPGIWVVGAGTTGSNFSALTQRLYTTLVAPQPVAIPTPDTMPEEDAVIAGPILGEVPAKKSRHHRPKPDTSNAATRSVADIFQLSFDGISARHLPWLACAQETLPFCPFSGTLAQTDDIVELPIPVRLTDSCVRLQAGRLHGIREGQCFQLVDPKYSVVAAAVVSKVHNSLSDMVLLSGQLSRLTPYKARRSWLVNKEFVSPSPAHQTIVDDGLHVFFCGHNPEPAECSQIVKVMSAEESEIWVTWAVEQQRPACEPLSLVDLLHSASQTLEVFEQQLLRRILGNRGAMPLIADLEVDCAMGWPAIRALSSYLKSSLPVTAPLPPAGLCDPLTGHVLLTPIRAADGNVYGQTAFTIWCSHLPTSPITGLPLSSTHVSFAEDIHCSATAWLQKHNLPPSPGFSPRHSLAEDAFVGSLVFFGSRPGCPATRSLPDWMIRGRVGTPVRTSAIVRSSGQARGYGVKSDYSGRVSAISVQYGDDTLAQRMEITFDDNQRRTFEHPMGSVRSNSSAQISVNPGEFVRQVDLWWSNDGFLAGLSALGQNSNVTMEPPEWCHTGKESLCGTTEAPMLSDISLCHVAGKGFSFLQLTFSEACVGLAADLLAAESHWQLSPSSRCRLRLLFAEECEAALQANSSVTAPLPRPVTPRDVVCRPAQQDVPRYIAANKLRIVGHDAWLARWQELAILVQQSEDTEVVFAGLSEEDLPVALGNWFANEERAAPSTATLQRRVLSWVLACEEGTVSFAYRGEPHCSEFCRAVLDCLPTPQNLAAEPEEFYYAVLNSPSIDLCGPRLTINGDVRPFWRTLQATVLRTTVELYSHNMLREAELALQRGAKCFVESCTSLSDTSLATVFTALARELDVPHSFADHNDPSKAITNGILAALPSAPCSARLQHLAVCIHRLTEARPTKLVPPPAREGWVHILQELLLWHPSQPTLGASSIRNPLGNGRPQYRLAVPVSSERLNPFLGQLASYVDRLRISHDPCDWMNARVSALIEVIVTHERQGQLIEHVVLTENSPHVNLKNWVQPEDTVRLTPSLRSGDDTAENSTLPCHLYLYDFTPSLSVSLLDRRLVELLQHGHPTSACTGGIIEWGDDSLQWLDPTRVQDGPVVLEHFKLFLCSEDVNPISLARSNFEDPRETDVAWWSAFTCSFRVKGPAIA